MKKQKTSKKNTKHYSSSLDKFICNKSTRKEKIHVAEIEPSLSIACHSSIRSIDHISEVIKKCGKNSVLGNITCIELSVLQLLKMLFQLHSKKN